MDFVLLKAIHLFFILFLFAAVFAEAILLKPSLPRSELKRLALIDAGYGLSAVIVLISGLLMVFYTNVGKGSAFYTDNVVFYLKLFLFLFIGLLSALPTLFFIKQRSGNLADEVIVPVLIRNIVYAQLLLFLLLPWLAVLLANGIHLFG